MGEALLITPVTPAAGGNGLAMRAGLFLTGLSRSFRVHCLVVPVFGGPGRSDGLVDRLAASVRVLTLAPSLDPVADLAARLAEPAWRARATAVHPRPRLSQAATVAAAREVAVAAVGVDVVHVHRLYLLPFLDALFDDPHPGSFARPVVTVDVDDVDELTARRDGDDAEADAYSRLGASYLPAVDCAITVSAGDAARLVAHGPVRVVDVPNAVPLPSVAGEGAVPPVVDHDLVFVGAMGYAPNAGAVDWLCGAVLPELPGVSLAIVGSDPPPAVEALGRLSGVTVVGAVADVAPWYERARVAVVPVHRGGGTRIKLLEALAHERPVVSTTLGAEGLDLVAGRDGLLVADDPRAFADHCRRLLADPAFARELARAGRELVARTATVDVVSKGIDGLFRELTAGREAPPVPDRLALLGGQLYRNRVAAEVCTALVDGGVGAILLKGASFATWLYDSALERTSSDVDVLVDPVDEQAAARILDGLGFRTLHGRSAAMLLGHPAVEWVRGADCVDLHRGRFWGITVPPETAWSVLAEHRETITLGGRPVAVLDEAGRALQLVVHAAASGPTATRTRADFDRALERLSDGVWEGAAHLARQLGAEAAFATGLGLTDRGAVLARSLGVVDPARWDRVASVDATLRAEGAPRFATGIARWMAEPRLGPRIAIATRVVVPTPSYLARQFPWTQRSSVHLACAYVAWLGVLARGLVPAVVALRRATRRRPTDRVSRPS